MEASVSKNFSKMIFSILELFTNQMLLSSLE